MEEETRFDILSHGNIMQKIENIIIDGINRRTKDKGR
jgi:hypothetical protein